MEAAARWEREHNEKRIHRSVRKKRDPYDGLRPWSAITHGLGAVLALMGTALLLGKTFANGGGADRVISFLVYGGSMVCLYTASALYHCVNTTPAGRIALRKYDHISIFLLIAGTYTPVCVTALRGTLGWTLLGCIWGLTVLGTIMTLFWINCPRVLSAGVYIVMGWLALAAIHPIRREVGAEGLFWLLLGGVLYTLGGVLYACKWPGRNNPRFGCHEIFHVLILLGSLAHYLLMYRLFAG